MTGKVFADSSDIYQDQARVLFDYYKRAAEKIVSEEMELEGKIDDAEKQKVRAAQQKRKALIMMIVFGVLFVSCAVFFLVWYLKHISLPQYVLYAAGAAGVVFLIFLIKGIVKFADGRQGIKNADYSITAYTQAKADIRREYKVTRLGAVYVPVASRVPFEGKSFVVDHTGSCPMTDFSLSILRQGEEFQKSLGQLEERIANVPAVEGNDSAEEVDTSGYSRSVQSVVMHDYMGGIDREVRNISYLLGDSDTVSVSLPVVKPMSDEDKFLGEFGTSDMEYLKDKPIVNVFGTDGFSDKLSLFNRLSDMNKALDNQAQNSGENNTEYLKRLMRRLSESVTLVSQVKVNSTSRLVNYTNKIFAIVAKASFNQYSPTLEAEEIERVREASFDYQDSVNDYKPFSLKQSSRVRYDLFGGAWVAEDGSRTNMPFGMNQIQEEVLMPVINNLMNETRVERLKIYNGIKDQKMHYLNEWNKDVEDAFRDNRKAAQDLIADITQAYSEYNSAYQTYMSYKSTQDALKASGNLEDSEVAESDNAAQQIAGFELQAQQCNQVSEDFQNYMDRLQEDILAKSQQFEHIEYYEASLRDGRSRDEARSQDVNVLQNLSDRQKRLIPLGTYSAVYAQLPPEPSSEEALDRDFALDLQGKAQGLLTAIAAQEAEQQQSKSPDAAAASDTDKDAAPRHCEQSEAIPSATEIASRAAQEGTIAMTEGEGSDGAV